MNLVKAVLLLSLIAMLLGMPLLFARHRIRPAMFALIKAGMTEAEVEELLGAAAGDYDGYALGMVRYPDIVIDRTDELVCKMWTSRDGSAAVWFDRHNRLYAHAIGRARASSWWSRTLQNFVPSPPPPQPTWPRATPTTIR